MSERAKFTPIRGIENTILNMPFTNGNIYFTTDTGKMYLDCYDALGAEKNKLAIGGGGVALIYGNDIAPVPASEEEDNVNFSLLLNALEAKAGVGDLILNTDGCFYKVLSVDSNVANCLRLAVSGSGGGGSVVIQPDVKINFGNYSYDFMSFIYGQETFIQFTPEAERDAYVSLRFLIFNAENNSIYEKLFTGVRANLLYKFDIGQVPMGTNLRMVITLISPNSLSHPTGLTRLISGFNIVQLGVHKDDSFVTTGVKTGSVLVNYFIDGGVGFDLKVYPSVDGESMPDLVTSVNPGTTVRTINIPALNHGVHKIGIKIGTTLPSGTVYSDEIIYEIAWADPEDNRPLIWVKESPETVVLYENCVINYMVYDPVKALTGSKTEVVLLDSLMNEEISTVYPQYSPSSTTWLTWDLTENYHVGNNIFTISCGTESKDIIFDVTTEGSRDLGLINPEALKLNLSSIGRSNEESLAKRTSWTYTDANNNTYTTTFNNFNWYNNGWKNDNDGLGAYLSVANGSAVDINFMNIPFNTGNLSYTIELRFRVKNVQEYSTLVKTEAFYYVLDENGVLLPESVSINTIKALGLKVAVDKDGNWLMDEEHSIKRTEDEKGVCFKFCDEGENLLTRYGLFVGTQEAYFKTPNNTVNVRYKEDDIINLTITAGYHDLLSIYLNGILAGAVAIGNDGFMPNTNRFLINSKYCDIDIYKLRVYQSLGRPLTMPEVIHNYIADEHDLTLYDLNLLAKDEDATALSYKKICDYNDARLAEINEKLLQGQNVSESDYNILSMPYATIEIIDNNTSMKDPIKGTHRPDDDRLPYVKGGKRYCEINFVNPVADALLDAGIISEADYYSHAPSYKVIGCEIDVLGTSSQGYPRRNFKTKMKSATGKKDAEKIEHSDWGWFYTKGSKAGKAFKKWNMDNPYNSTNKFTWKIDYMESSGTYNTGFANLMGNMYDTHPLDDYNFDGVSAVGMRTSVYGFPVLTFQKHSTPADKAKIGTTFEDEIYEYIGRYNMNLDKSSNEYYGFEVEGEQKYINAPWDEEVENDGVTEIIHHDHPLIADIAECWELRDNQGTWCSFTFPLDAERYKDTPGRNDYYFGTYEKGSYDGNGNPIAEPKLEVINHFEYRYSPYGDELDACYEYSTTNDFGLSTFGLINLFIREKYANLELLMIWIDSTNRDKATNQTLAEAYGPIVTSTPGRYVKTSDVEIDLNKKYYILEGSTYNEVAPEDLNERYLDDYYEITRIIPNEVTYTEDNGIYYVTYYKDTAEYRLEKFRNEFTKHLNLDYCAIYYVLTELLLCYDSRGKNMMIASWGPQEVGGDYIWYPIFYDIDTLLGLNNIGATLWDYDTDASKDGTFSTPSSVLWVNFADAFETKIVNTYKALRASKLTETNIEGAYLCDPDVFDSYAMRGVRPIIAIGLDEYVKYLKPSVTGFLNTDGDIESDSYGYVYAINGDRKLSRELLIRNRLNYLDSYWRAGSYATEVVAGSGGSVLLRANANADNTSDKFLDSALVTTNPNPNLYQLVPYNAGNTVGLDAIPEYTLTPFLSQYVFTFVDTTPSGRSIKFQGTPVEVIVSDSVLDGYKAKPNLTQLITRIPGPRYLSSLGDLSTKYLDQFEMQTARRLVDLIIGSDIEGYYNNRNMANFILNDSLYTGAGKLNENRKTLLQKVVLTNMGGLSAALDLSGSEKLQEFRALGTQIQGITFAEGAPLTTVHLPRTVNGIVLVEAKNLNRLLVSKPVIRRPIALGSTYYEHSTYEGLYIESVTDINDSNVALVKSGNNFTWTGLEDIYSNIITGSQTDADVKSGIKTLSIKGGNFKYESYKLLMKALATKEKENAEGVRLKIDYEDVDWCPYTQLSIYDEYDSTNANKYFEATDHSSFVPYTYNVNTWMKLLKNGKLYYYNQSADESIITSLDLLDFFIKDYDNRILNSTGLNHYTDVESTTAHWPRLTGIIYVNNTSANPIQEDKLTSIYAEKWPDLTIFAAHIAESNLVKFVQMSNDGRENELDIKRLPVSQDHPVLTDILPSKGTHYDFIGWSTDAEGEQMFIEYDSINQSYINSLAILNNYSFSTNGTTLVLYALFITHNLTVEFVYPDGSIETQYIPYNTVITFPDKIPYIDDSALPREMTYEFLGWNYTENENNLNAVINKDRFTITKDYLRSTNSAMHSVWRKYTIDDTLPENVEIGDLKPISVFDNIHPEYFTLVQEGPELFALQPGCEIRLNKQVKGKLVIPAQFDAALYKTVVSFCSRMNYTTFNSTSSSELRYDPYVANITHLFFESLDANIKKRILEYTFSQAQSYVSNNLASPFALKYVAFDTPGLLFIGRYCFYGTGNLSEVTEVGNSITTINIAAFYNAFSLPGLNITKATLTLGHNISLLGAAAFGVSGGHTLILNDLNLGKTGLLFNNIPLTSTPSAPLFAGVLLPEGNDKVITIHSTSVSNDDRYLIAAYLFGNDYSSIYGDRIGEIVKN